MKTPASWKNVSLKYLSSFCFITGLMVVCSHGLQFSFLSMLFLCRETEERHKETENLFELSKFKAGVTILCLTHQRDAVRAQL